MIEDEEFCCDRMKREIKLYLEEKVDKRGFLVANFWYDEETREFLTLARDGCSPCKNDDGKFDVGGSPIFYCPFCGKKFPESLYDIRMDVLLKEFGVTGRSKQERLLPYKVKKEFSSDAWWKNRKLNTEKGLRYWKLDFNHWLDEHPDAQKYCSYYIVE